MRQTSAYLAAVLREVPMHTLRLVVFFSLLLGCSAQRNETGGHSHGGSAYGFTSVGVASLGLVIYQLGEDAETLLELGEAVESAHAIFLLVDPLLKAYGLWVEQWQQATIEEALRLALDNYIRAAQAGPGVLDRVFEVSRSDYTVASWIRWDVSESYYVLQTQVIEHGVVRLATKTPMPIVIARLADGDEHEHH